MSSKGLRQNIAQTRVGGWIGQLLVIMIAVCQAVRIRKLCHIKRFMSTLTKNLIEKVATARGQGGPDRDRGKEEDGLAHKKKEDRAWAGRGNGWPSLLGRLSFVCFRVRA